MARSRSNAVFQNLGFQIQDVAVQAQMGTDSLRILGQQGSQFLSVFGVGGAVAGAVVALGAAFASWIVNVDGASESLEELEKAGVAAEKQLDKLKDAVDRIKEDRVEALSELIGGEDEKKRAKAQMKFEKDNLELAEQGAAALDKRTKYERELAELQAKRERDQRRIGEQIAESDEEQALRQNILRQDAIVRKANEGQIQNQKRLEEELRVLAEEGAAEMAKERAKANEKAGKEKAQAQEDADREAMAILRKDLDAQISVADDKAKDFKKGFEDAEKERKKAAGELASGLDSMLDKTVNKIKDVVSEAKDATAKIKQLQAEAASAVGDQFDENVRKKLLSPAERAQERAAGRAATRAGRSVNTQQRIREAEARRNAPLTPRTGVSRETASTLHQERNAFVKKNTPKITTIEAGEIIVSTLKSK